MAGMFRRMLLISVLLGAVLLGALLIFRGRYREMIRELAQIQIKNATSDLTNEAIALQMAQGSIRYDRIICLEKDLDGRITALKTNIGQVNRLKTEILDHINREIPALDASALGIPLGSLILPEFFSGRGPVIPVRVLSIRNSDAEFSSVFSQAGINQTLHRLTMDISVEVAVLILAQSRAFSVGTQVVVAETVIVGQVPDTYLQTGGNYGSQREN